MRAAAVGFLDRVRHDGRWQSFERLGVLLALPRIDVAAAFGGFALALLCLLLGRRHPLRLGTDDLLRRKRELVLDFAQPCSQGVELRVPLGEPSLKAGSLLAPSTRMSLGGQRPSLIMAARALSIDSCKRSIRSSFSSRPSARLRHPGVESDAGGDHAAGRRTYFTSMPSSNIASVVASSSTRVARAGTFGIRNRPCDNRL